MNTDDPDLRPLPIASPPIIGWVDGYPEYDGAHHELTACDDILEAINCTSGWAVRDSSDQLWWPDDATQAEIQCAADPAASVLEICRAEPDRGEWHC